MASTACPVKLIVGLDYGTTYSGLGFALSTAADFKDIITWTKYPGAFSHSAEHSVKAPTRIAFAEENPDLNCDVWGYQVEPGMRSCSLTKLLLDKSALLSDFDVCSVYDASTNDLMRLPEGKTAKEVATSYLRQMYNMFEKSKKELFGSMNLDELPVEFWLTVPASWSEKAKLLTKAAAMEAGFGNRVVDRVMLISEPEAAAQYTLKSSFHQLKAFVQKNTGVMVCDCGGGTVLREIAVGIAGKCGATFVDRNFFKLMTDRFGYAFLDLDPEKIGPGSHFMNHFEQHKKDFGYSNVNRRAYRIPLFMPALKYTSKTEKFYEKRSSSILLTHGDLMDMFKPVVKKIIFLIEDQVYRTKEKGETPISTIVLVGGFASSPYLRESIQDWCDENEMRLTTPMSGAWSAVVCGAVLRGLEGSIVREKKCRRHYGTEFTHIYDPAKHGNYDRSKRYVYTSAFDHCKHLSGFINWQFSKGEKIHKDTEINFDAVYTLKGTPPLPAALTLYSCNLDIAPDTIESPRVERVGNVMFHLTEKHVSKAKKKTRKGVINYNVPLMVNVRLNDEAGHLVYRVMQDGEEIARANMVLDD
ncbi:Hsp70 family protein [Beauveria brongniartii RCEF 3172]|uniref:Hsp70 family protein n=1 Tax=Beauveria brongniartii RCEF 3172 TaxID=1081107 RepID=A0A167FDA8_9HYPO|nr:Hsp70 family protein [Beauveria brongniartii RCEF 3172]